jgi:hypothetical protein
MRHGGPLDGVHLARTPAWQLRPDGTGLHRCPASQGGKRNRVKRQALDDSGISANALARAALTCTFSYAVSLYGPYRYFM